MMIGFCSAILFSRGIFGRGATGVFRSNRILIYDSLSLAANRMISSASGVSSFEFPAQARAPARVPWLMFKPSWNGHGPGSALFRFYNLAENRIYNFFTFNFEDNELCYWRFVGTSNGWLGVYDAGNHDLWLVDPMTDLLVRLPPVDSVVHRLLVVDNGRRLTVVAQGPRSNLAFCSLDVASWTSFALERRAYDSLAYSSRDRRLLCISREWECELRNNKTNFEIWNLEGKTPKLEWEMHFDFDSMSYRPDLRKLKYIVCEEESGELFVVVRSVRIRHDIQRDIDGCFVDGIVDTEYKGSSSAPFRTTNFKVYKVDQKRKRLILMKDSLQGLAMFVGTNQPMAIPAAGLVGVKPDSVYFTYDSRIKKARSRFNYSEDTLDHMHDYRYSGDDFGIFNYVRKNFSSVCNCNPNSDHVYNPMWFI